MIQLPLFYLFIKVENDFARDFKIDFYSRKGDDKKIVETKKSVETSLARGNYLKF